MQLIAWIVGFLLIGQDPVFQQSTACCKNPVTATKAENIAYLKVGERIVFDSMRMAITNLTVYPNQLMFAIMDGEGQHITVTFAGKDISQRRPNTLSFSEPGLYHGYSEASDVFFISFGKFDSDRQVGQILYDYSYPKDIMEGELKVISWTATEFVFEFKGKLGNVGEVDEVNTPEKWVPFSGMIRANDYQKFN
jgi:hypothetical protein